MANQLSKTKETANNLGIWMDHASAHLMDFTKKPVVTNVITSKFTHHGKVVNSSKTETMTYHTEQHQLSDYYKKLAEIIKNYKDVVLFGPADAKIELYKILRANHHFDKIKIDIKQTDIMTENQELAFVKEHFTKY